METHPKQFYVSVGLARKGATTFRIYIPKEVASYLNIKEGDTLVLREEEYMNKKAIIIRLAE